MSILFAVIVKLCLGSDIFLVGGGRGQLLHFLGLSKNIPKLLSIPTWTLPTKINIVLLGKVSFHNP